MGCSILTLAGIALLLYAYYMLQTAKKNEQYVAVYQAPILESKALMDAFVLSTQGEDLVEPFQIDYSKAAQVGVAGYVPGYDSMNPSKGWNANTDLEMAAKYGDLNVIGALATGTYTKSMNV